MELRLYLQSNDCVYSAVIVGHRLGNLDSHFRSFFGGLPERPHARTPAVRTNEFLLNMAPPIVYHESLNIDNID